MYFRLLMFSIFCAVLGCGNALPSINEMSEEDISSFASGVRPGNEWGGRVVSFSRNLQSYNEGSIGSIRASFTSFDSEERERFVDAFLGWYEERGLKLELKATSLKSSNAGESDSLTFLLVGDSSKVYISIIYLGSRFAPSVLVGPQESVDNYLFLFHRVES